MSFATSKRVRAQRYDLARRCEEGIGVRCYCRCRGGKHGARRVDFVAQPFGLSTLPSDDPHYVQMSRHPAHLLNRQPKPQEDPYV